MDAPNEYRIRLLAIAIQGMSSQDAEKLLRFMPEEYRLRIRARLKELGEVTQEELDQAVLTIDELLQSHETFEEPRLQTTSSTELSNTDLSQGPTLGRSLGLDDHPIEAMVEVLCKERPTIIATILRHLPSQLGQSIVQHLELNQARAALEWIPKLDTVAPRAIEGVMTAFELQVRQVRKTLESRNQSQEKLRELLAVLEPASVPSNATEGESSSNTGRFELHSLRPSNGLTPIDLPSGKHSEAKEASAYPPASRPFVIPLNRKSTREEALESLLKLDDLDLLRVLYQHDADEVKQLLAGANKAMRLRIEKLTHPKSVKQLRNELSSAPITDEKTWRELADRFTQTALQLSDKSQTEDQQRIPA